MRRRLIVLGWIVSLLVAAQTAQAHNPTQAVPTEVLALGGVIVIGLALVLSGAVLARIVPAAMPPDDTPDLVATFIPVQFTGWVMLGVSLFLALVVQSSLYGVPVARVALTTDLRVVTGWPFGVVWFGSVALWVALGVAGWVSLRAARWRMAAGWMPGLGAGVYLCVVVFSHTPDPTDTALFIAAEWALGWIGALLLGGLVGGWALRGAAHVPWPRYWAGMRGLALLAMGAGLLVELTSLPPGGLVTTLAGVDGLWLGARGAMFVPALVLAATATRRRSTRAWHGAEAGLFAGAFAAVWLIQLTAPTQAALSAAAPAIFYDARQSPALVVDLTLDPAVVGANTAYVSVVDATSGARLNDAAVTLRYAADGQAATVAALPSAGDGLYTADGLAFASAGVWSAVVEVERGGQVESFAFSPSVGPEAARRFIQPGWLPGWGAAVLLLCVLLCGGIGAAAARRLPFA